MNRAVDVVTLHDALNADPNTIVIDVREPDETMFGTVPGAWLIPLGTLQDELDRVPDDATVYLICRSGGRSAYATDLLLSAGKRGATNVSGGMIAWQGSGLPVDLP
jgi:rhodanese-related sulfurtransferase